MAVLRLESGIYGFAGRPLVFLTSSPSTEVSCIYRFRDGRWALMAAPRNVSRNPAGARGTQRGGKMAVLRIGSGILWAPGSVPGFLYSSTIYGGVVYRSFKSIARYKTW